MWLILQSAVNREMVHFPFRELTCPILRHATIYVLYVWYLMNYIFLGFSGFLVRDDYEDYITVTYNNTLESRFEPLLLLGGSIDELDIPEDSVRHTSWSSAFCFHQYHVTGRCCCLEGYNPLPCHLGSSPMCQLIHATTCDYYLFLLVIFFFVD